MLRKKIRKSHQVIRDSYESYGDNVAVAWTGGKDSTVLLHLIKSYFGSQVPFPVVFNDSTMEFEEVYDFVEEIAREWELHLLVVEHRRKDRKAFYSTTDLQQKKELLSTMKIHAIQDALRKYKLKGLMAGIRWDEHPARAKEKYLSLRDNHMRIHPILHFTESDVWHYIRKEDVPYINLYDKGYRSLGEMPFTNPTGEGKNERSGREADKEKLMEKLRKLGYW